jgi:hypothetical protein
MEKIIKIIMLFMITATSFLSVSAQKSQIGIGIKIDKISGPNYSISNFPERIRDIPRHADDRWLSSYGYANNTLPDKTLNHETIADYYCNAYVSLFDVIRGGISVIIPSPEATSSRFSQNQHGTSSRGYGTSLRYYEMKSSEIGLGIYASLSSPVIKLYSDTEVSFGLRPIIVDAVYQVLPFNIKAEAGWDRYGFDEKWKTIKVGSIRKPYITYGMEISLGVGGITNYNNDDLRFSFYTGYSQAFIQSSGEMNYTGKNQKDGITFSGGIQINL